jgi:hypothetical protein
MVAGTDHYYYVVAWHVEERREVRGGEGRRGETRIATGNLNVVC